MIMSGKLSVKTYEGKRVIEKVVAAMAAIDSQKATQSLNTLFAPVLEEGETMPDWKLVLDLDQRLITQLSSQAETSDQSRGDSLAERKLFTTARATQARILHTVLRGIERRVRAAYGGEALGPLGLGVVYASQPDALAAEARTIRDRCRMPALQPSTLQVGAKPFTWEKVATDIDAAVKDLEAAITKRSNY
jgi:hypothetical protein